MTHRLTVQVGLSAATLLLEPRWAAQGHDLLGHLEQPEDPDAVEIVVGDVPQDDIRGKRPFYRGADLVDAVAALDDHAGSWHAHTHLVLHAGAAVRDGRTVVVPGPSGSGKSAVIAALIARGWSYLSDEMVLVHRADHAVTLYPRPLALRGTALGLLPPDHQTPTAPAAADGQTLVSPLLLGAVHDRTVHPPSAIVFPRWSATGAARIAAVSPAETLHGTAACLRNLVMIGGAGLHELAHWTDAAAGLALDFSGADDGAAALEAALFDG